MLTSNIQVFEEKKKKKKKEEEKLVLEQLRQER
jgi:hypothetical protein